jgi:hypothetical protein
LARYKTATLLRVAVVTLVTAACGGKSGTMADAGGGDAPAEVGADSGNFACDPGIQGCGATEKCDFTCQNGTAVVACVPDTGGGAIGSTCSTTTMQCAGGSGCVTMAGGSPTCRKYCTADSDCATGERCHNVTVGVTCTNGTSSLALHYCY